MAQITKHGWKRAEFGSTEQAGSVKVEMCLFFPPFFCFFGSLLCCLTGCLIAEQVEEAAQRPRSSDVVVVSVDKSSRTENSSSRNPDADLVIVNYEKRPHPKDAKLADDVVVISSSSKVPMMAEAEAKAL